MNIEQKDLTIVPQNTVDELINLDLIPAIDKAHILLVAAGIKPAMHTGFFSEFVAMGEALPATHDQDKITLSKIINDLGLNYKIQLKTIEKEVNHVPSYTEWVVFCIAKDMSIAKALFDARKNQNEKKEGILLGFPASAVNAFVNDTMLDMSKVPALTKNVTGDEMKFLNHRLSQDEWENEIRYLPEYAHALKQMSPAIYDQCIAAAN